MKNLIIIGAGGHGRVIADIALSLEYHIVAFLDIYSMQKCIWNIPVIKEIKELSEYDGQTEYVIALGDNELRRNQSIEFVGMSFATLIHPHAVIGLDVVVGQGTVVMAGAIINSSAVIGKHCIINTGAVVEHDDRLEDYIHVSPGAILGGSVEVGSGTHIGIGATIRNNVRIVSGSVIGMGAVVVKDIIEAGTYVGIPARMSKHREKEVSRRN